ncbi:Hypothetical predicted protein [Pelobates cultripes]|uniref:Uncharacterized protein n=1 Tax=Pelobates cultripes TaxID=61616 RepID=A0AAD1RHC6_PELCU|nr:Hypothetical predicted protein [Pelobates cultripes]
MARQRPKNCRAQRMCSPLTTPLTDLYKTANGSIKPPYLPPHRLLFRVSRALKEVQASPNIRRPPDTPAGHRLPLRPPLSAVEGYVPGCSPCPNPLPEMLPFHYWVRRGEKIASPHQLCHVVARENTTPKQPGPRATPTS